jgi:hypothetical protein
MDLVGRIARIAGPGAAGLLVVAHPVTACMVALHGAGQRLLGVALVLPALRGGEGSGAYAAAMTATGVGAVVANAVAGNVRAASVIPAAYCLAWIAQGMVMVATNAVGTAGWIVGLSVLAGAVGPFCVIGLRTHLAGFDRDERLLAASRPGVGFVVGGAATVTVAAAAWAAYRARRGR